MTSVDCGHFTAHILPNVTGLLYVTPPWDHAHHSIERLYGAIFVLDCLWNLLVELSPCVLWGKYFLAWWEATPALTCICTAVQPRRGSLCRTLKGPLGKQVGCPVRGLFWWPPAAGSVRRQEKKTLGRSLSLSALLRQEAGSSRRPSSVFCHETPSRQAATFVLPLPLQRDTVPE